MKVSITILALLLSNYSSCEMAYVVIEIGSGATVGWRCEGKTTAPDTKSLLIWNPLALVWVGWNKAMFLVVFGLLRFIYICR